MGLLSKLGREGVDTLGVMPGNAAVGALGGVALSGGHENPDYLGGAGAGALAGAGVGALGGAGSMMKIARNHMAGKRAGEELMFAALDAMKRQDNQALMQILEEAQMSGNEGLAKNIATYLQRVSGK